MVNNTKFFINSTESAETVRVAEESSGSIFILLGFFVTILALFGLGIGLSYACYKRELNKRRERERMEQERTRSNGNHQQPYRALTSARFSIRGIPNWYAPNPKEEKALLLETSVVPAQLQSPDDSFH